MSVTGVVQELLVRYLDVWTPTALHARRATFAYASPSAEPTLPEAALRVFAEFADRMRGRRLGFVVVTPDHIANSRPVWHLRRFEGAKCRAGWHPSDPDPDPD